MKTAAPGRENGEEVYTQGNTGRKWSSHRGFGVVNAGKAVAEVKNPLRKPVGPLVMANFPAVTFTGEGLLETEKKTFKFFVSGADMSSVETFSVLINAHVVRVDTNPPADIIGSLLITVKSPSGKSPITLKPNHEGGSSSLRNVRITTRAFHGENPRGMWEIAFTNLDGSTPSNDIQLTSLEPTVWGAKGTVASSVCCDLDNDNRIDDVEPNGASIENVFIEGEIKTWIYKLPVFTGNEQSEEAKAIVLKRPFIHRCILTVVNTINAELSLQFFGGFSNTVNGEGNPRDGSDIHSLYSEASMRIIRTSMEPRKLVIERAFRAAENPQQCWFMGVSDSESDDVVLAKRQADLTTLVNLDFEEEFLPADTFLSEDNEVTISLKKLVTVY